MGKSLHGILCDTRKKVAKLKCKQTIKKVRMDKKNVNNMICASFPK